MNDESVNKLIRMTEDAYNRISTNAMGFQHAYIFVLTASNTALKGHEELKKAHNNFENSLSSPKVDSDQYFLSILFLDFISELEIFFSNVIKAVVSKYPKKLGSISFKLSEILDSASHDELVTRAADNCVYKLMYKKPFEYLDEMCDLLSIDKRKITPY